MVDITFLHTYKGTLYPLEHGTSYNGKKEQASFRSLIDLCSEKIVQDATSTHRAMNLIPMELSYNLMRAALRNARDRAIEVLISRWPWKTLSLRTLVPPLFNDLSILYDDCKVAEYMKIGVKYTMCLAHTFVECLKRRAPTKLKYLDMTGFPAAEVIVNYLSSHVLLVHNETRQKQIINRYNEVTANLPTDQKSSKFRVETTLPEEQFAISLDVIIENRDTHMELCRALKSCKAKQSHLNLSISQLDLTGLGVAHACVLLESLDPKHVHGLSLQYNGINNENCCVLLPNIVNLTNITSLDLSCNKINLGNSQLAAPMIGTALGKLQFLRRFDFSNSWIRGHLRLLLSDIQLPLHHLRICGCGLLENDLVYLRESHHVQELVELDLSDNNLGRRYQSVWPLVESLSSHHLVVLELEATRLEDSHCTHLFNHLSHLQNVRYINLSCNQGLNHNVIQQSIPKMAELASLKAFKISYPEECYQDKSDDEEVYDSKTAFSTEVDLLIYRECLKLKRQLFNIVFHGLANDYYH